MNKLSEFTLAIRRESGAINNPGLWELKVHVVVLEMKQINKTQIDEVARPRLSGCLGPGQQFRTISTIIQSIFHQDIGLIR